MATDAPRGNPRGTGLATVGGRIVNGGSMPARRRRGRPSPPPGAREPRAALIRELVEFETAAEGSTAEPEGESGTLPGSVGGTTGTAGRTPGNQTAGATAPAVPRL